MKKMNLSTPFQLNEKPLDDLININIILIPMCEYVRKTDIVGIPSIHIYRVYFGFYCRLSVIRKPTCVINKLKNPA